MTNLVPAYAGEAMLLRWSETPKGRTVTLLLDPLVSEQHPFKNLKCGENGQRMQLAAVLVGDDEKPVPPPHKASGGPTPVAPEGTKHSLTRLAAIKIRDATFQYWLAERFPDKWEVALRDSENFAPHAVADHVLKSVLGISSKKELDSNPEKATDFERLLASYDFRDQVRS